MDSLLTPPSGRRLIRIDVYKPPCFKPREHGVFIAPTYPFFTYGFSVETEKPLVSLPHEDSRMAYPTPLTKNSIFIRDVKISILKALKGVEDLPSLNSLLTKPLFVEHFCASLEICEW